jgi:hypothetical protein
MANTWSYNDWRRQSGATAQRERLLLHIEEVEQRLADWQTQGAYEQRGSRYDLEAYLNRLCATLERYDQALGLSIDEESEDSFIQAKPLLE